MTYEAQHPQSPLYYLNEKGERIAIARPRITGEADREAGERPQTQPGLTETDPINEPTFDHLVKGAVLEVEAMRLAGKLRPFVEGEPIGAYKKVKLPRRLTAAQVKKEQNERMQRRQAAMLAHRRRNDEALAALLNKRF